MMRKQASWSEEELVAACVRNERQAQEQFYRQFFPAMLAMCMRHTRDKSEAIAIINGGFLRVFQKLHTFQFKGSLEGWVRRLVFNSLSEHFKKNRQHLHFMVYEEQDQPVRQEALSNLYLQDILDLAEKLPNATKQVFFLYAIEGYTHVEIARELNISEGTSKWHLSEARKRLQKLINEQVTNYAG